MTTSRMTTSTQMHPTMKANVNDEIDNDNNIAQGGNSFSKLFKFFYYYKHVTKCNTYSPCFEYVVYRSNFFKK